MDFVIAFSILMLYFAVFGLFGSFLLKKRLKHHLERFRKIQHLLYASSVLIYLYIFNDAFSAILGAFLFLGVAYVGLLCLEKTRYYHLVFHDRFGVGEVKQSIVLAQVMFMMQFIVFWAVFDVKVLILIGIYAWGLGDAIAALMGKRFGKQGLNFGAADSKKTVLGSVALWVVVSVWVFISLFVLYDVHGFILLGFSILIGCVASFVEAISKHGVDTFTLPISVTLMTYISLMLLHII